jgi:tRNA(Ile)-lysidine synthase
MSLEMVAQVRELLRESVVFEPGEPVVVAVSGGLDSMVLLDVMDRLRVCLDIQLRVAHLDHQLRPESAGDSQFVADAARQRGLPCIRGCRDVAREARTRRLSLEAAARQVRYQFLAETAAAAGARKIVLGHHADDQAETVLLRLARGSGAGGLGAMAVVREGRYLRPLLGFERAELEAYARLAAVDYREDASNRDLRFARNRVRHELLPQLRRFNPAIVRVLNRTARVLKDEDEFLGEIARRALAEVVRPDPASPCSRGKIVLDAGRLIHYHIAVQRRVVRMLLQGLSASEGPFDFCHVEKVLDLLRRPHRGLLPVAAGLMAQRAGERLVIGPLASGGGEAEVAVPGETRLPEGGGSLQARLLPAVCFAGLKSGLGGGRAVFDADRTGGRLRLRPWRPGDRFQPLGMDGHKKVSDFLVDRKWPRLLRDEVRLLVRLGETGLEEGIVWVVGLHPAHPFRVRPDTREIVLLELIQRECSWTAGEG